MGFFKRAMLPTSRGFDHQSGLYNAQGDHYEHTLDGGYDWHREEVTHLELRGQYSGNLVRDDAVRYIHAVANVSTPYRRLDSNPGLASLPAANLAFEPSRG